MATMARRPDPDPTLRTMQLVDKAIDSLRAELQTRFDAVNVRFQSIDDATRLVHEDYVRVPTVVDKATGALRELMTEMISSAGKISLERLARIDGVLTEHQKAIAIAVSANREFVDSRFANISAEVQQVRSTNDEIFKRIEVQFSERDKRTDQLALASSTAIAAALQAAKEAVGAQNTSNSIAISKSEQSTLESLRQLRELFSSEVKAINAKVDDIKARLDRGEGSAGVRDPAVTHALERMTGVINKLSDSDSEHAGHAKGLGDIWGVILGAAGLIGGLTVAAVAVLGMHH
jgi:hypothetical protein